MPTWTGNDGGCFGIKVRMDTMKMTNMIVAEFGQRRDLI